METHSAVLGMADTLRDIRDLCIGHLRELRAGGFPEDHAVGLTCGVHQMMMIAVFGHAAVPQIHFAEAEE